MLQKFKITSYAIIVALAGEAYEAIENLREAVSTFRHTVGEESCGLNPLGG